MCDGLHHLEKGCIKFTRESRFAETCREYEEDPPGEMMYDAFVEFIKIMAIVEDHFTY